MMEQQNGVDGAQSAEQQPLKNRVLSCIAGVRSYLASHPVGFWFIFWGELAERCCYYGMLTILLRYMSETDGIGLGDKAANRYTSFFKAGCYLLPLVGGYVADKFFGKYRTIVGFSVPYIAGMVILSFANIPCLIVALLLLAMGSGVIKPNISTLMGLTYDQQRPGQEKLRGDAFAMFYGAINIGAAFSSFTLPEIRDRWGYKVAFLIPAVLMTFALSVFALGKRFYAVEGHLQSNKDTGRNQGEMGCAGPHCRPVPDRDFFLEHL